MLTTVFLACALTTSAPITEAVRVAPDGRGFVLEKSGRAFVPWGFNYDHDDAGRLIEDYWDEEWPRVEGDFREMAELGANVVRVHLQYNRFMEAPDKPNAKALDRLGELLGLAERTGLYLDITGLGCYHAADTPTWYDDLDEAARWKSQAAFWRAVALRCRGSNAVFCYDLMNEPVVPGGRREPRGWLGPPFAGKCFVQFVTLDQEERPRPEIARAWIDSLVQAIREVDPKNLITVGMVDWSLDRPGLTSGFVPEKVAPALDFVCVHLYPKAGKVDEAIETLKSFAALGKPVVIEETFPLSCSMEEFEEFLTRARPIAAGVTGFYWGRTIEELSPPKTISEAITLRWLELFRKHGQALEPGGK
jgi:hypothetical protein